MSDESTQTNISALERVEREDPPPDDDDVLPARQHPLPWILFGVAAVMLALVGGLLARRLSLETRRANEAVEKNVGLTAQMDQLRKEQNSVDEKIAAADAKVKAAETAAADAAAKLKALEAERDKLQKDLEAAKKGGAVATAEPAKKAEPPPKKGKAVKKKKRRR